MADTKVDTSLAPEHRPELRDRDEGSSWGDGTAPRAAGARLAPQRAQVLTAEAAQSWAHGWWAPTFPGECWRVWHLWAQVPTPRNPEVGAVFVVLLHINDQGLKLRFRRTSPPVNSR